MKRTALYGAVLAAIAGGCDARATAAGGGGDGMPALVERRSRALESCAATAQCVEPLRCVARVCRAPADSVLGEFYEAAGELAMSRGETGGAVDYFNQALAQYDADQLEPPPELYCAQGRALVAMRADKQRGEMAARVLHRCLLGTPPGLPAREGAMRDLALLLDLGLDPATLARKQPGDAYLVKEPPRPGAEQLKLSVQGDPKQRSRTYTGFVALLATDPIKQKLVPCWEEHWKATHSQKLEVTLPFRYRARLNQYEEFERSLLTIDLAPAAADPAASPAQGCVRDALTLIADEYAKTAGEASWNASVTLALGP